MDDIVLLTKEDEWCQHAGRLAQMMFGERVFWVTGKAGNPLPDSIRSVSPRVFISFLSPWVIPKSVLERCGVAINFHPGSARYPGTGCYNFALYEEAERYGAVCHEMAEKVDAGAIIDERTFPVFPSDTVEMLKYRTMIVMTAMYMDVLSALALGQPLTPAGVRWERKPFTRKQLNDLCVVSADMPADEIRKRVRATTYPGYPGASISLGGVTFSSPIPNRKALA